MASTNYTTSPEELDHTNQPCYAPSDLSALYAAAGQQVFCWFSFLV